jgi:hypothetical protein
MNLTAYFPSILSILLFSSAPASIEAKMLRGLAELGDQRCKSDSIFEEYWNNQWFERGVSLGTKCCPHVDDPKRITLYHEGLDCPAPTPSCTASYSLLAGDLDAEDITELSGKDDATVEVDLGFDFKWLGGTNTTSSVHVSSNGQIVTNPGDDSDCYDPYDIGTVEFPRIAVSNADLNLIDGNVYIKRSATSTVISYENAKFLGRDEIFNVQAHLFPNGNVNICFGEGDINTDPTAYKNKFVSGLEGGENDELYGGPLVAAPIPGAPFNDVGITSEWPTVGSCYCFTPEMGAFVRNSV